VKRRDWISVGLALASASVYSLFAVARGALSHALSGAAEGVEWAGFPLDDAWIHQVFARNLATRGEFAFFPGQPSAGSTSPLWTFLLSLGYVVHLDFRAWTYLLGALFVGMSAVLLARLARRIFNPSLSTFYFSLFILFEWHLAWSAVSGMEIPLFVFLSLFLFERFYARERGWLLGLLAGLLTFTRPEGVVLAALVGVGKIIELRRHEDREERAVDDLRVLGVFGGRYALGFAVIIAPYLLFNLATSGTILPNTFYAKSAEYAELFNQTPFIARWAQLLLVPFVGAQVLLLPGLIYLVARQALQRQWLALVPFVWLVLLPALYAARLPVAYQHGRYEMPVVPFIALYGIWGTAVLLERIKSWAIRTTWAMSTGALLVAFWFLGATSYATDVAIVDCEMVHTARWVAANAPADAVVAAHDIGALGYFYGRPFIDLAGLASPDLIPFMRDEGRLRDYLFSRHATFAVFFPDWYPALASDPRFVPAYQTGCMVTRQAGGTNMTVYQIK